jgi:tRNA threonylcarbamoyladenosine biosynthesis protein TsaE
MKVIRRAKNLDEMHVLGGELAKILQPGTIVYLNGQLGAGKTTLIRSIVAGFGYVGRVKSPSFTLMENYQIGKQQICHYDLYRLQDPEDTELIGMRDSFSRNTICFVEWPERGGGLIAKADIICNIKFATKGRIVELLGISSKGVKMLQMLEVK